MPAKKEQFRTDIAILRGFSIALVILCHFNFYGFSFGFIGVDIFFVISGYLISQSLYREFISLDKNGNNSRTISLATFYLRRARRLLPAALTVILAVNIISFFLYNSEIRNNLFVDSKWALFFLANVAFLRRESNYFQMESQSSFLEHYWSLSVEEQFYAIWPLFFLLAATFRRLKFRKKQIRFNLRILIIFFATSLASYLFLQKGFSESPLQVYFSLFSRAWELGIGGFFGVLTYQKRKTTVFSLTERLAPFLVSILIVIVFINQSNWANIIIFPVIATGFLLYSGNQNHIDDRLNEKKVNIVFRFGIYVGGISYSLYLVHWPIYVIASRENFNEPYLYKCGLILVSFLCAHLLWKYIEKPFQRIPISKLFKRDTELFNFLKARRKVVGLILVSIIGALYFVSLPSSSSLVTKLNTESSSEISSIKNFAYYESQLLSDAQESGVQLPDSQESGVQPVNETSTVSSSLLQTRENINSLVEKNSISLKSSIKDWSLTSEEAGRLIAAKKDASDFEYSICSQSSTDIPPAICLKNADLNNAKKLMILGDSKMGMLADPIAQYFESKKWKVQYNVMAGCHFTDGFSLTNKKECLSRTNWTLDNLRKNKYDLIVFSEYPSPPKNASAHEKFFELLKQSGNKVILLGTMTQIKNPAECLTKTLNLSVQCTLLSTREVEGMKWARQMATKHQSDRVFYFDTAPWFCTNNNCPLFVNGNFTFRDGVHLSNTYVQTFTPLINAVLDFVMRS